MLLRLLSYMSSLGNSVRLAHWLKIFSRWDGWLVAAGTGIILLGWAFENEMLKSIFPGLAILEKPYTVEQLLVAIAHGINSVSQPRGLLDRCRGQA